ncbi:aminoglycoside phosphotransferase family protein [Clostridium botulinum]|uniref:aminoglycoside phosphotransferase family protein n=1 Tax=Clostridium botulinum TaxID=1491 RepID=UPI003A80C765
MEISVELVRKLINEQFPEFDNLEVKLIEKNGHDNRTFHLGDTMSVRLPSEEAYAPQIEKEKIWLPKFKKHISCRIPIPIANGEASNIYPYPWSINKWIDGDVLSYKNINNLDDIAIGIAKFLKELQAIDSSDGPAAGSHNFYRGGLLKVYNDETTNALNDLKNILPTDELKIIWERALESTWDKKPVWVHGDIAVGNILIKNGKIVAVIDFGILGTGDPACDYVMAWTFFDKKSRIVFKQRLMCDDETWNRAKGWALWKALISYNMNDENSYATLEAKKTINEILND